MFFNKKNDPPKPQYTPIEAPEEVLAEDRPKVISAPVNMTKIGEGITFYGDFETEEPMEINGHVRGNINSTTSIEISATGTYVGDARMENLVLSGTADGNLDCIDLTKLTGTGNMVGNLSTSRLITEDGSNFGGNLQLVSDKAQKAAAAKTESLAQEPVGFTEAAPAAEPDIFEAADSFFSGN